MAEPANAIERIASALEELVAIERERRAEEIARSQRKAPTKAEQAEITPARQAKITEAVRRKLKRAGAVQR